MQDQSKNPERCGVGGVFWAEGRVLKILDLVTGRGECDDGLVQALTEGLVKQQC